MKNASILYFFPDCNKYSIPEEFKFRFKKDFTRKEMIGPGGKRGLLCSPFSDVLVDYIPDKQKWQKIKNIWIGIDKNIKPEDIVLENTTAGYFVELGDGNKWIIPVAMLEAPNFSLPQYETLDEDGNWVWKVDDKYSFLSCLAEELWNSIDDKQVFEIDEDRMRMICCAAIGINYNVTDMECAVMRLLTQEAYIGIMKAMIDSQGVEQIMQHMTKKKRPSADKNTNSGNSD
jgi:hypothetical protein